MIVDERISGYLKTLEPELPDYLEELEKSAIKEEVPIIRKESQALLRFLLRMRRPARILEVGTAVGFSCMYMAEYMPKDARIATIEKVPMRLAPAKQNLKNSPQAAQIALLIGEAEEVLAALEKGDAPDNVYCPAGEKSAWRKESFSKPYEFIFLDAAKGQYMYFLPHLLALLHSDGILVTDNVLQEGSITESKFTVVRRDRTIHKRMREYLYELTHQKGLNTVVLPVGDGMSVTTRL